MTDRFVIEDAPPAKPRFAIEEPRKNDNMGVMKGAIADTLGLTDRPGAQRGGKALVNPETPLDYAINLAVTGPVIALSGGGAAAAGLPALAGRLAASGALGAAQQYARGGDASSVGVHGLLDAIVAGLTEGAGGLATKALGKVGAPARAFEWASKAPSDALEAIKARLPAGKWLNVPSLGSAKLTVQEAVEKLSKLTGDAYRTARAELASEMSRLDAQKLTGPKPLAGAVFKDRTSPDRFAPSGLARVAEVAKRTLGNNDVRSAMDASMNLPFPGTSAPLGAVAAAAFPPTGLVKHLPGGKAITEVVEEAE